MLRSLNSRLLAAFIFVVVLSVGISAAGTLLLLRDQQRDAAEERFGRLAEPITLAAALLEQSGLDQQQISEAVRGYAESFDVRVLLVDADGRVVSDTESRLAGTTVESDEDAPLVRRGSARFRVSDLSTDQGDLLLFSSGPGQMQVSTNRLIEVTQIINNLDPSLPRDVIQGQVESLLDAPQAVRLLPEPSARPLIAVPEQEITSAWREILPQLSIAGVVALVAAVVAAWLISRSISRPLARMTRAAQEMARGHYDQELDLRGRDEVGRLAQAFNVMAREVGHSHQMMRDLLANVSHELKTPLTSIQGFSQAMEEGAITSPEEFREAGRIINEETQRMRSLVDDLIDLSRLESGQAVMQHGVVDLAGVLESCWRRFERQAKERRVDLRLEPEPLPSLDGDERRLEQVFANLIDNAVRHTPDGGHVTVRAAARNGHVRVAVRNSGSYIPPADLERVFERFYQLDRNRTRTSGGAGLGLAIAKEVVQAHRGEISASSNRDQGTEFIVTLPIGVPPTREDSAS